jgi:transcriptional regulator with XRE-family HTH domain
MIQGHIGQKLVERRNEVGLSHEELARAVSVHPSKVLHWEAGRHHIPASLLWNIAIILEVEITYFYEGLHPMA